ncbi:MAG: hypothetical protein KJ970_13800 [Candidatus Eisenbacteria bacterium]|uniref:Nucleotidyl transferase domain-containing protein n=1 Tax=Eiseniibacteriota bacterium TaxID=2212470 RepID=A0A948W6X4_UNCEI|nr:hypothetical protein [Candidatus Eisenbacteria bacterium]MBU1949551.1 hypothetical protein [Candidatus Eisenbacteria bacterium]MBU2691989.1 hypothetical protein [Candidatus Eisenbacteria bacterium]
MTLRDLLEKLAAAAPAAIPVVGTVYAQVMADIGTDQLKGLLSEIKGLTNDRKATLNATNAELMSIQDALRQLVSDQSRKDKIPVIIPVGGEGGSLFPVTQVMPKCLVTIGCRSMLQHIIDPFYRHADLFERVTVLTGKYSDAIEENVKQGGYGDFVECKRLGGATLPAVMLNLRNSLPDKPFVIHYNDVLIENCDWPRIYNRYFEYKKREKHIGMLLCSRFYPHPLGIGVIREGRANILETFTEKPEQLVNGSLANVGIAMFEPELFEYIEASHRGLFEDTIAHVIKAKRPLTLYRVDNWHHIQDLKALYQIQNFADLSFLERRQE